MSKELHEQGGQPNNRNNQRHGLRSGKLPADCKHIENSVGKFRRQLEDALLAKHGSIDVLQAAYVQSAVRHETRAALCNRWLWKTEEGDKPLELSDKLNLLRDRSNASDSRDKCLEKLRLDRDDTKSIFDGLYQQHPGDPPVGLPQSPAQNPTEPMSKPTEAATDPSGGSDGISPEQPGMNGGSTHG